MNIINKVLIGIGAIAVAINVRRCIIHIVKNDDVTDNKVEKSETPKKIKTICINLKDDEYPQDLFKLLNKYGYKIKGYET